MESRMQPTHEQDHDKPSRREAVEFFLKFRVLIAHRWWRDLGSNVKFHPRGGMLRSQPVAAEESALLWSQVSETEFPLTVGKVQNLRAACRILDGIEVPAREVFSFWKQLGRTTRSKGFTEGRELRSGCMVPNLGGGLCQLSGLLHAAAVKAGVGVIERHAHSRSLPGSPLAPEHDVTVFWNYVDLQLWSPVAWRLEARLTATELVVTIRTAKGKASLPTIWSLGSPGTPVRAAADGDCLTCGVTSCFRNLTATRNHAPAAGHCAWVLDGMWPEFNAWCQLHSGPGDHWITPLDGNRWSKMNYAWSTPDEVRATHATWATLRRSWRQRRLPGQGAVRQRFLLESQRELAENFARRIDPQARHVVVSQSLLPHLWKEAHLGGRTFDVLANRWPLTELQGRLDQAAALHPESETLSDFRADLELVATESEAFAHAARIVTPHRGIAALFGERAILLDWEVPVTRQREKTTRSLKWFFPASALGRKGIYELVAALQEVGGELLVLGRARESGRNPLEGICHRRATLIDLADCTALVIPAWVEHEPRLALRALSMGIPVIASVGCGLAAHPLVTSIKEGDVFGLVSAMKALAFPVSVGGAGCALI